MRVLTLTILTSLIVPPQASAQRAGSSPSSSPSSAPSSRSYSAPTTSTPFRAGPTTGAAPRISSSSSGGGGSSGSGGTAGSAVNRPTPVRSLPASARLSAVGATPRPAASQNDQPSITDPVHPLNPLNVYNPASPMSPLSPLNPINSMYLYDDDGREMFKKVLKVENLQGTFSAYQCLLHVDEWSKPDPMEQNCTLIGVITPQMVQKLTSSKKKCDEMTSDDLAQISMIGLSGAAVGASIAMIIPLFFEDLGVFRWLAIGGVLGAAAGWWLSGWTGWTGSDVCRDGISALVQRLSAELERSVPKDHARLLPLPDAAWVAFDAVIK